MANDPDTRITREHMEHYLRITGPRGQKTLARLNRLRKSVQALETEQGKAILGDVLARLDSEYDAMVETMTEGIKGSAPRIVCPHCSSDIPARAITHAGRYSLLAELYSDWSSMFETYKSQLQTVKKIAEGRK